MNILHDSTETLFLRYEKHDVHNSVEFPNLFQHYDGRELETTDARSVWLFIQWKKSSANEAYTFTSRVPVAVLYLC